MRHSVLGLGGLALRLLLLSGDLLGSCRIICCQFLRSNAKSLAVRQNAHGLVRGRERAGGMVVGNGALILVHVSLEGARFRHLTYSRRIASRTKLPQQHVHVHTREERRRAGAFIAAPEEGNEEALRPSDRCFHETGNERPLGLASRLFEKRPRDYDIVWFQ